MVDEAIDAAYGEDRLPTELADKFIQAGCVRTADIEQVTAVRYRRRIDVDYLDGLVMDRFPVECVECLCAEYIADNAEPECAAVMCRPYGEACKVIYEGGLYPLFIQVTSFRTGAAGNTACEQSAEQQPCREHVAEAALHTAMSARAGHGSELQCQLAGNAAFDLRR